MGKFKIVVIGNGGVGKTSLICRWMGVDIFPELYIPSVLEPVTVPVPLPLDTMQVSGSSNATTTKLQAELEIWDTPGQDDWNQSWPQAFRNAHCVVICFSIGWEVSLECVEEKWIGTINRFGLTDIPILLVGCQRDLRSNQNEREALKNSGERFVRPEQVSPP
ncbi:neuronal RhoA GEF protein [Coprinopsis cinerea AmutBmut pab1-1]|nr:neuronal RhoA GEF protein [Coprinopsis cinerea AmutBmut pab1-1]